MHLPRAMHQSGFTLIEVLMVIVIMGILLMWAAPSFVEFTGKQRAKTASFDLYAALTFARSESIKRRQPVTLSAVGGDWRGGWTVIAPDPTVSPIDPDVTVTLRQQDPLTGVIIEPTATSIVFRSDGRIPAPVWVLVKPEATHNPLRDRRCILVQITGLARSTVPQSDPPACPPS